MIEELQAMTSGKFIPYYKAAMTIAVVISLLFSIILRHSIVYSGKVAVIDLDASHYSTELITKINTSPYIEITEVIHSPIDPVALTAHDTNIGVLYIPKGLERSLHTGDKSVNLGYFADYSNASQNSQILQILHEIIPELGAEISINRVSALQLGNEGTQAALSPMQLKSRNLYNPTNSATISTSIYFVYFFSSLTYGLTALMIIGRLRVTGSWQRVLAQGPLALMCRIIPYAFFYTTAITFVTAMLVFFGQLKFDGNYFMYLPSIFMTGLAFGWLAFILSWGSKNPGEGAGRMIFLVPPGFIMGGATMAVGILPMWAYQLSYLFPLVWQFRFYRDYAMRGVNSINMLATYGAYLIYLTIIAFILMLFFYRSKKHSTINSNHSLVCEVSH